ncbi:hypothetical protein RFI_07457, partial [Reticulomyxa filosa]
SFGKTHIHISQNEINNKDFSPPLVATTANPTRKPTKRPTMRPTSKPTLTPTATPTVPGQGYPQFYQGWGTSFEWETGYDSQSCYANGNSLFVFGGKNSAQGKVFYKKKKKKCIWPFFFFFFAPFHCCCCPSSLSYEPYVCHNITPHGPTETVQTFSTFDASFNQVSYQMLQYNSLLSLQSMTPFYCPNGCSGGYKNRIYLVNPYTDDGTTTSRLFECTIVSRNKTALCKDLCDPYIGILPYCSSLLLWDACVTTQDQYLYIVGGRDSVSRRNTVTVFDMAKRDWASVPSGTPAAARYPTLYGTLPTSVINSACATWDFNIYVFGGQTSNNVATNTIQKCQRNGGDCVTQNAVLNIGRYYASAENIGSSIVVLCGAHDAQTVTDVVELYDIASDLTTVDYNGESSGLIIPSARRSCCVKRWDSQSTLVMTGGVTFEGSYPMSISSLSTAPYGIQENMASGKPLAQCDSIVLQSSNPSFFGGYFYYADIKGYRVWVSNQYDSVIYYQPDNYDFTWIGNLSSQTWSYYPNTGFSSDYWIVLATKTTPQQSVYFNFICLDSQTYSKSSGDGNTILGVSRPIFIAIVVVVVVAFVIAGIMLIYFLKKNKTQRKEIVIQSSTYGTLKKLKSGSTTTTRSEERTSTTSDVHKTTSFKGIAETRSFDRNTTQEEEEEQQQLTEKEAELAERGGVYVKGYRATVVKMHSDNVEESLSSVNSNEVHYTDHRVFTKAGGDVEPLGNDTVVNAVTGEIERIKPRRTQPANATTYRE